MSFISKLRKQIEEKTEENRRKRLDAGEHDRLEGLFKQLAAAKDKLLQKKRKKKQEAAAGTEQPEETKVKKPSPFASLPVVGGSPVKVNAKQFDSLKQSGPFTQHITAAGETFPISITVHEGRKVVLPLANVVLGCAANVRVVQKNGEPTDFTTDNLMVVETSCEPEPAPTPQDYRERIAKLRKI